MSALYSCNLIFLWLIRFRKSLTQTSFYIRKRGLYHVSGRFKQWPWRKFRPLYHRNGREDHSTYFFRKHCLWVPCIRSCRNAGSIARTKEAGIKIGAHPGLPDLMGFGRRNMAISPAEAKAYTLYQISALGGMCQANGMRLQHVKPHGPYTTWLPKIMRCLSPSARRSATMTLRSLSWDYPEVRWSGAAKDCGLKAASEVFADRGYEEDGTLVNRRKEGALIKDEDEPLPVLSVWSKKALSPLSPERIFRFRQIPYVYTEMAKRHYFRGKDP